LFIPPPPTTGAEGIIYAGRRSGCPLTPIASEAVSLYSVDGFQRNLPQIFIMSMAIALL